MSAGNGDAWRRERIARRLARLPEPLEVLAEDFLGLESRIDLLARDPRGQVVLVLLAEAGADLARLTDALAQRAWSEARVADWARLAPERGLRPDLGVRVLLLAPRFDPRTLAAAESLAPGRVELATYRWVQEGEGPARGAGESVLLDGADAGRAGAAVAADEPVPRSRFRTGLRDEARPPPAGGGSAPSDEPPEDPLATRGAPLRDTG